MGASEIKATTCLSIGGPNPPSSAISYLNVKTALFVLHGYGARVQGNPQALDGPGFKMLRNALFSSHTLMVELILFLSSQWLWHRGTIAHWG